MPGSTRQSYLPFGTRRFSKPRGMPQIIRPAMPRGLILCAPLANAGFQLAYAGAGFDTKPNYTSSPHLATTPRGMGLALTGGTTCVSYGYNAQPPNTWSMEALCFVPNATAGGSLCGWNQSSTGNSATHDRTIVDQAGFVGSLFDGGTKTVSIGNETDLSFRHFIVTCDGSNLRGYQKGALQNTTAVSNGGFTGYSLPVYFCIGESDGSAPYNAITPFLVNFANVAWTAQEVLERYTNPFGFLSWPEDRRHYLVGVAAGGGTSYSFPTTAWRWNAQAPVDQLRLIGAQKPWLWNARAPIDQLQLTAAQKPWRWNPQAPSTNLALTGAQKAVAWAARAPVLSFGFNAVTKAWTWVAANPIMAGGSFVISTALRYAGLFRRRRSRPPM